MLTREQMLAKWGKDQLIDRILLLQWLLRDIVKNLDGTDEIISDSVIKHLQLLD